MMGGRERTQRSLGWVPGRSRESDDGSEMEDTAELGMDSRSEQCLSSAVPQAGGGQVADQRDTSRNRNATGVSGKDAEVELGRSIRI